MTNEEIVYSLNLIKNAIDDTYSKDRDTYIKENVDKLIDCFSNLAELEIANDTPLKKIKQHLAEIYEALKLEYSINLERSKPSSFQETYNIYQNKVYSYLYTEFKKQDLYTKEQALSYYSDYGFAKQMWNDYLELMNEINQNRIALTTDRTLVCSYFNITLDTYNDLRNSDNEMVANLFNSIEEYIIGYRMTSAEIGTRKDSATNKNLKVIKYGNEIEEKVSTEQVIGAVAKVLTEEQVIKKLKDNSFVIDHKGD